MYDVIITGARCAGAALAFFLGQGGHRVLLIDKYTEPGPTLSTHIIGETEVYERLGIADRMSNAGAPAITRMRVDRQGVVLEAPLVVTSRVIGLRRELLDRMLLDAAAAMPTVDLLLGAEVVEVETSADGANVACRRRDGRTALAHARAIVGADGRHSTVANRVSAESDRETTYSHGVCYFYARSVMPLPIPAVEWYWHEDGLAIVNPIDGDQHCIAVMVPTERMTAWLSDLHTHAMNWLRTIGTLQPRLERCALVGKVKGAAAFKGYVRRPFGARWALVGDAGAHLHPVSGVGIDNAVCCAEYLAHALGHFLLGEMEWQEAMNLYAGQRDDRILPQFEASIATLAKALEPDKTGQSDYLKMLCTFPSLAKSLGQRAEAVYQWLTKEETSLA